MKKFLAILTMLFVSFMPIHQAQAEHAGHAHTTVYAVAFHADWCGSCKLIKPNMVKARGKAGLDNKDVLFVTLDLTNDTTRHQSKLLAGALGLGDFYETNAGKTGFVLLVDGKSGKHLGKITKDMDAGVIITEISKHI